MIAMHINSKYRLLYMHLLYLKKLQSNLHLCNHNMPRHRHSHKYFFLLFVKFDVSSSFSQQRESQSQRYVDGKKVYDSSLSKSRYVLVVAFIMLKVFSKAPKCLSFLFYWYLSIPFLHSFTSAHDALFNIVIPVVDR